VQGDGTQLVGLKEAYFAFRVGGLIALLNQLPPPINQFRAAASSMRYSDNLNFLSRELFLFKFLYRLQCQGIIIRIQKHIAILSSIFPFFVGLKRFRCIFFLF
jgi:hypothetical protein